MVWGSFGRKAAATFLNIEFGFRNSVDILFYFYNTRIKQTSIKPIMILPWDLVKAVSSMIGKVYKLYIKNVALLRVWEN